MTENTPMVMPVMVKAARNLFAPREDIAMIRVSRNDMSILILQLSTPSHSYLNAVTGSKREADHAGAKPEIKPVNTATIMLTTTKSDEK